MKIRYIFVVGIIAVAVLVSACEKSDGNVIPITNEPKEEVIEISPILNKQTTPLPTEEVVGKEEYYRQDLLSLSESEMLTFLGSLTTNSMIWNLITQEYLSENISRSDFIESWEASSPNCELKMFSENEDTVALTFAVPALGSNYIVSPEYMTDGKEEWPAYVDLNRDMLILQDGDILSSKYSNIPSSYIKDNLKSLNRWEVTIDKAFRTKVGNAFMDRMFYYFDHDNYDIDVDGVLFMVDQLGAVNEIIFGDYSTQEKMNLLYNVVYLSEEMTVFEKSELLCYSQGFFILAGDGTDLFDSYSVNGRTMKDWQESLFVSSLEELNAAVEESEIIIADARAKYPIS
ncbi:MAG: hypothetical protein JXN65_12350 [Clostridia bacterium]|nr:hypothetical protein [Clostridia bacterium]